METPSLSASGDPNNLGYIGRGQDCLTASGLVHSADMCLAPLNKQFSPLDIASMVPPHVPQQNIPIQQQCTNTKLKQRMLTLRLKQGETGKGPNAWRLALCS